MAEAKRQMYTGFAPVGQADHDDHAARGDRLSHKSSIRDTGVGRSAR